MSKHILLGVTGSIAAYKAAELVRLIKSAGHEVSVVMTQAATEFVRPLTFKTLSQNDVALEMFDDSMVWDPVHIKMSDKADLIVVAPCTANVLAKVAHGIWRKRDANSMTWSNRWCGSSAVKTSRASTRFTRNTSPMNRRRDRR